MIEILGILGAAVLFALFGLVTRERRGRCGTCSCAAGAVRCGAPAGGDGLESDHEAR